MRILFLAFCMIFPTRHAFAALCSEIYDSDSADTSKGPCTPDPGKATEKTKRDIVRLIKRAKEADADVSDSKAVYLAVKLSTTDKEKRLAALQPLYDKKTAQNQLYHDVLKRTAELYHVAPDEKTKTIAKPYDPAMEWMSGPTAEWDPQVTDSFPGLALAVKIAAPETRATDASLIPVQLAVGRRG